MRVIKVLLTFYCVSSVCNVFGQNLITSNNTLLKVGTHKLLETSNTDDNTEMEISNSNNPWMLNESKIDARVNPLNDSPYLNHPGIPHNLLKINSEGSGLKYFTSIEGALTGYIDNQNLVSQAASFWINGQSRIDNKFLVNSGDQGDYKLQVGGGIWNDGIVHLAATAPVLSFQLGSGSESDYWIGRNTNELIRNSASIISDKIGGNSWYNGSLANGHRWFDGALSPGTLMQLKTDGELLLGSVADQGAYRLQMNTPVSGNGVYVDASINGGSAFEVKAKDQTWAWHAENGIAKVGLRNIVSGSAWTIDASNTKFSIVGRSADVTLTTDASGDIYILPGRKLKMNLGSDATGDIYYRNSSGDFSRLAAGSNGEVLTVNGGLPTWAAGGSGSSQWTTLASDIYYNSGNVGIGAAIAPAFKLDVNGTARFGSNTLANSMVVTSTGDIGIGINPITNMAMQVYKNTNSTVGIRFENVNTGANSFTAIQLGQDINATGTKFLNIGYANPGILPLGVYQPAGSFIVNNGSGGLNMSAFNPTGTPKMRFFTGNGVTDANLRMIIDENGKVGIGTINTNDANYKLFVETGIRTRKVKVDQNTWPDYVFEQDYHLPSLKEVEAFIQQNKRLPEVPSSAEIENDGLNLGDNQAVLLKKIEELTLYLIDTNKKLEKLAAENEEIKKKLEKKKNAR